MSDEGTWVTTYDAVTGELLEQVLLPLGDGVSLAPDPTETVVVDPALLADAAARAKAARTVTAARAVTLELVAALGG